MLSTPRSLSLLAMVSVVWLKTRECPGRCWTFFSPLTGPVALAAVALALASAVLTSAKDPPSAATILSRSSATLRAYPPSDRKS